MAADDRRVPAAGDVVERGQHLRRRESAHLDVRRQPDAELHAVAALAALPLLGAERLVADDLERAVEPADEVAGVELQSRRDRVRLVERRDVVHPPDLRRVLADAMRERVHRPLDRIRRLRAPGAAVRIRRCLVREHARALEVVALDVVDAAVEERAEQRDAGRHELVVRAHVGEQLHAHAAQLPLLRRGQLDVLDHAAAVDGGDVRLGTLLDPLHRRAELARDGEAERLLGVDVQLRAEAAADVGCDHAELGLGDPERQRERRPQDVRDLRRRPDRELALRRDREDDHAARLDRVRDEPRMDVPLVHEHGRFEEDLLHLSAGEAPRVAAVVAEVLVDHRRAVGRGRLDLERRVERLPVDDDRLGRVDRVLARVRDHDRDAVAGEARLVLGERPVRRHARVGVERLGPVRRRNRPRARQAAGPLRCEILAGERRDDAGPRERAGDVDLADARVRVRAAHDGHPDHPRQRHVVDVARLAGDELRVLLAQDALADVALSLAGRGAHDLAPASSTDASRTAATMFW